MAPSFQLTASDLPCAQGLLYEGLCALSPVGDGWTWGRAEFWDPSQEEDEMGPEYLQASFGMCLARDLFFADLLAVVT